MKLAWYIRRLGSMSPAEVVHRLGERMRQEGMRHVSRGWTEGRAQVDAAPQLPGLRNALDRLTALQWEDVRRLAAETLAGRFAALGVNWPQRSAPAQFPESLWRLDPVTGNLWPGPERFSFDISYRHQTGLGDVKYVWEFNRLQWLQAPAAMASQGRNREPIALIEAAIASWYSANPPFRGVGWNSGIEVALRAISLLLVSTWCGEQLSPETVGRIRAILSASLDWLHRFPSRHSSANNHRIAELAGIYLICLALPDGDEGGRLRRQAAAELSAEIEKQIFADGAPAEQSPTYGAFSVEFASLCVLAGSAAGDTFAPVMGERLLAFAEFVAAVADSTGQVPALGDNDEGRVIILAQERGRYPAEIADRVRTMLKGASAVADGGGLAALPFDPIPRRGGRSFATGGLSAFDGLIGGRQVQLIFDHGPLGYLSIAAHGHADALAICLTVDGAPVLIDPGTYLYQSGGKWRDWFRGTAAHNTLNIAGANQSVIAGPFNWQAKAVTRQLSVSQGEGWHVGAEHDGYRNRFGIVHRREIAVDGDGCRITDRLVGPSAPRDAEIVFQLDPDCSAALDGKTVLVTREGRTALRMTLPSPAIKVVRGGEIGGGWASRHFGEKVPADRISWRGPVGPAGVVTRLDFPRAT